METIDLTGDAAPPPRVHCPVCDRSIVEFEDAGDNLVMLRHCGHTMCTRCFENGGFKKRPHPNALQCPICRQRAPPSPNGVYGTRVYLDIR